MTTKSPPDVMAVKDFTKNQIKAFKPHVDTMLQHLNFLINCSKAYNGYMADRIRGKDSVEKSEVTRLPNEMNSRWESVLTYVELLESVISHREDGVCIR